MGVFRYSDYENNIYAITTETLLNCQLDPLVLALKSGNEHYRVWLLQRGYNQEKAVLNCTRSNHISGLNVLRAHGYM